MTLIIYKPFPYILSERKKNAIFRPMRCFSSASNKSANSKRKAMPGRNFDSV